MTNVALDWQASRRAEVLRLISDPLTLERIGQLTGITGERVRQILKEEGVTPEPMEDRYYRMLETQHGDIERLFLELRSDEEVAEKLGVPVKPVRRLVDTYIPDPGVLRRRPRSYANIYSDSELIACIQECARSLPSPMSANQYGDWARDRFLLDGRPWPGHQVVMLRFRWWRAALAKANLPSNPHAGPEPVFSLDDASAAVIECWKSLGHAPTVREYDKWPSGDANLPSSSIVRRLGGSWDDQLLAAWPVVHGRALPGVGSTAIQAVPISSESQLPPLTRSYETANDHQTVKEEQPFQRDPKQLERALRQHMNMQNELADAVIHHGLTPLSPASGTAEFDVAWRRPTGELCIAEVKSATPENLSSQLRLGLGQLLY
jgi:hypothetical protein